MHALPILQKFIVFFNRNIVIYYIVVHFNYIFQTHSQTRVSLDGLVSQHNFLDDFRKYRASHCSKQSAFDKP